MTKAPNLAAAAAVLTAELAARPKSKGSGGTAISTQEVVDEITRRLLALDRWPQDGVGTVAIYVRISKDVDADAAQVVRQTLELVSYHLGDALLFPDGDCPIHVDNNKQASRFKRLPRPAFDRLTAAIAAGKVTTVLVVEFSRAMRDTQDVREWLTVSDDLRRRHLDPITLVSAGMPLAFTPSNEPFLMSLVGASGGESAAMSARQRRRNEAAANSMAPVIIRRVPFGYRRSDGEYPIEPIPELKAVVQDAARRLLAGTAGVATIMDEWNAAGMPTLGTAERWTCMTVRQVLVRPTVVGDYVHLGKVARTDAWLPLMDRRLYDALVAMFDARKLSNREPERTRGRASEFTGLYVCSSCKRALYRASGGWRCQKAMGGCGHRHLHDRYADAYVMERFYELWDDHLAKLRTREHAAGLADDALLDAIDAIEVARGAIADLDATYRKRGKVDPKHQRRYDRLMDAAEAELDEATRHHAQLLREQVVAELPLDVQLNIRAEWAAMPTERRALLLRRVIKAVMVERANGKHVTSVEAVAPRVRIIPAYGEHEHHGAA